MDIQNQKKAYYHSSKTTVYSCQYHVIFATKYRRPVLVDGADILLKKVIMSLREDMEFNVIEMEVMPDHVHLLLDINPEIGIKSIVARIKGTTSSVLRKEFRWLKRRLPCLWTRSKFISTVGSVSLEVVKKYIEDQKGV